MGDKIINNEFEKVMQDWITTAEIRVDKGYDKNTATLVANYQYPLNLIETNKIYRPMEETNMVKEKTEAEKAYDRYINRKNKYSKYDLKIQGKAVILFNKFRGTKQVSVARDEDFDREKGLMMCLLKDMGVTYPDIQVILKNYDKEQSKLMKEKIKQEEQKAKRRAEQEANIAKKKAAKDGIKDIK